MLRSCSRLVRALPVLLFLSAFAPAQQERRFDDEALRSLARSLADWREASRMSAGRAEARAGVLRSLDELRLVLNGTDPLALPQDLARALWLAGEPPTRKLKPGKVLSEEFEGGPFASAGLRYALRLPKDYDPEARAYPLILAIPDEGRSVEDHLRDDWSLRELQDSVVLVAPQMPPGAADWSRVTVGGRPGGLSHVLTALRVASERFAVDPERVFVAGTGRGVAVALAAGNYSPQRFAGILARAGDAPELAPDNFRNLPTYFAGGGARARAFHEAARAAGFDNCTSEPEAKLEDLWRWMVAHPRRNAPERVTLAVGDPFPTRVHWLRIAPNASDARLEASIEGADNSLRIDGQGFTHLTLYLNDELVDLDRPVSVVCNGKVASASLQRHLATTLNLIQDGTSDRGCVYVTQAVFDLALGTLSGVGSVALAPDEDFEERLSAAGTSSVALWNLHQWCAAKGREAQSLEVLHRLVRLDPEHSLARQALGHVGSQGLWFTSAAAQRRFQRSQDPELAAARGLVEYKGRWMHRDERALAGKGRVKDHETGQWLSSAERKRLDEGWARQDLAWIPPEEARPVDQGLWLVDGEWLDLAAADRLHASLDDMWRIPSREVLLLSSVDRATSLRAIDLMGRAFDDLRRVFGAEPPLPLRVGLLRDEEQFDRFAMGDPDGGRAANHAGRLNVIHSGYFAESCLPLEDGKRTFGGLGVGLWDSQVPGGDLYGVHSARLAAGLAYVEALDPSPKAVRQALANGPGADYYAAYEAEHRFPAWLRYGAAVYAERYFRDDSVAAGGDPWWARAWSLENLHRKGGLRPLAELLAFPLDPDAVEDGQKLLLEVGLLVAFILDGACAQVLEAHADLVRALVAGRLHSNQLEALTEALVEHEGELRAFAGS